MSQLEKSGLKFDLFYRVYHSKCYSLFVRKSKSFTLYSLIHYEFMNIKAALLIYSTKAKNVLKIFQKSHFINSTYIFIFICMGSKHITRYPKHSKNHENKLTTVIFNNGKGRSIRYELSYAL